MNKEKITAEKNHDEPIAPIKQLSDLLKPKSGTYSGYFLKGIDKIVSQDDLRQSLQHAWFKEKHLYATNTYTAIKIHLDFLGIKQEDQYLFEGKSFNRDALKELTKITKDTIWYISELGITIFDTKVILFSSGNHNFPDIDAVIPKESMAIHSVSFNPEYVKLLNQIYKTLGGCRESLILEFHGEGKAIKSVGDISEGFEAIVMPII